MKENGKARRRACRRWSRARALSTPRRCWPLLTALKAMPRSSTSAALVPGRQRQGRHHRLARRSGRTWPASRPQVDKFKADTAAAVAAPPPDLEALKAQLGTIGQIAQLPRDLPHQERLRPGMGLVAKARSAPRSVLGGDRRGGRLVPVGAGTARRRGRSRRWAPAMPARGERIFCAGGCTSCHARPKSEGEAQLELAGGLELKTPFGTFVPPNISSDPQGRHRRLVVRGFRQRHDERRFAGRARTTIRPFPIRPTRA